MSLSLVPRGTEVIPGVPNEFLGGSAAMLILWGIFRLFAPYFLRMLEWRDKALMAAMELNSSELLDLRKEYTSLTMEVSNLRVAVAHCESERDHLRLQVNSFNSSGD